VYLPPAVDGKCQKYFDLATTPATSVSSDGSPAVPLPLDNEKQWAQYQEMNIGAAFYRASEALGAGDLNKGAEDLLTSMKRFDFAYSRIPTNPRDALDAILDFGGAPEDVRQQVGDAFADQGISYGVSVAMDQPADGNLIDGLRARIKGPGGVECTDSGDLTFGQQDPFFSPTDAWRQFSGPLSGRHDDCYVVPFGSDADSGGYLFWDLPYFDGNAHHDKEWSVDVTMTSCPANPPFCDQSVSVPVRVGTGRWHRPGEDPFLHRPLNEKTIDVELPEETDPPTWKTVATFDADGVCTVKTGPTAGAECGVGRKH
jgi:hypothetical protein